MEEIRSAAFAFHANSNEGQQFAEKLFQSLDTKGNGLIGFTVYVAKFKSSQEKLGNHITDPKFFGHLDKDDDGFLDKQDVITLSYLIQNGKLLFCDSCGEFLKASYFSCVACFTRSTDGSFYKLCSRCYRRRIFVHNEAHVEFSDNHSLLMKKRHEAAANSTNKSANATSTSKLDPTHILSQIMVTCVISLVIVPGVREAAAFFTSDHVRSTVGTSDVASASNAMDAGSDHVDSASNAAAGSDHVASASNAGSDHVDSASNAVYAGSDHVDSASNAVYAGSDHVASASDTASVLADHFAQYAPQYLTASSASVAADPSTFSDFVSSAFDFLSNFL